MNWAVKKDGLSFNKYKSNYFNSLQKKKVPQDIIELDFLAKLQEGSKLLR